MDPSEAQELANAAARPQGGRKRKRPNESDEEEDIEMTAKMPRAQGLRSRQQQTFAENLARKKSKQNFVRNGRKGFGDRQIYNEMPQHLFSGKRKMGKTQRR